MLKKLNSILTQRDKKFFYILIIFSIIVSLIEVIGISAIMPFLSVAMNFDNIHSNEYFSYIYTYLNFKSEIYFIIALGVALFLFYVLRSALNIVYIYLMTKFSQGRYHLIVFRLFENYMGMSYKNFINKNSSNLTKSIMSEANNLAILISSLLLMISEVFVVLLIYAMMLYVNYKITLVLTAFLMINAVLILKTISVKIKIHGKHRAELQESFYEIVNKSFGNFKQIKLQENDKLVLNEFEKASYNYSSINIIANTLLQVPRLLLEAIAFTLIILIVLYLVWKNQSDISDVIAVLSMFVLALYRLMPSANRILNSYNQILFAHKSLDIIHNDLMYDSEKLGDEIISYNYSIDIKNVRFEYEENKSILQDINFSIKKGDKIAFIGESGSGKSTLVDMLIGLYKPCNGTISVDGKLLCDKNIKCWRNKIGYIPQSVYLFDGTVEDNVVFGSKYNKELIKECLKKAKIYDFLKSKNGLKTIVGEGGIMLSGGQKQRIAIARALYTNPEILVLDEATSALDNDTEEQIMQEIYRLSEDKTLIIIAHRLSTIKQCDKIFKIKNGKIQNG